jgi:hypothetical protein
MSINREWLESLTWRCDICRKERPDSKISVHKVDIGPKASPGMITRNVKYCNDNPHCYDGALNWNEDDYRAKKRVKA